MEMEMLENRNDHLVNLYTRSDYKPGTALERLGERYPRVKIQFVALFGTTKCEVYLKSILFADGKEGKVGFEPWVLKAVEELLELNALKMKKVAVVKKNGMSDTGWMSMSKIF